MLAIGQPLGQGRSGQLEVFAGSCCPLRIALATPLPPIRFHDLRHGAASMLRAAKVEIKVISEILGHASTSFTDDVYTVVAEELAQQAAHATSASVPRRTRRASS